MRNTFAMSKLGTQEGKMAAYLYAYILKMFACFYQYFQKPYLFNHLNIFVNLILNS